VDSVESDQRTRRARVSKNAQPGIRSLADVIEVQSAGAFSYGWISSVTWQRTINRFTVVLNQRRAGYSRINSQKVKEKAKG